MKTVITNAKKWVGALAAIPALVLLSACEPQQDDPMVTDPDDETETEWGQRDREDPAPTQDEPGAPADDPAMGADDPAMGEQQDEPEDPAY